MTEYVAVGTTVWLGTKLIAGQVRSEEDAQDIAAALNLMKEKR
jgi:hypothetical protein